MTHLPPELLQQIFIMVKDDSVEDPMAEGEIIMGYDGIPQPEPNRHIDPNLMVPNEEYPSYKSFRQVNSLWHSIATPLLFQTIILDRNIDSWGRLEAICTTPHLAQHVRTIQLVTDRRLSDVSESAMPNLDNQREFHPYLPNGGPCASFRLTAKAFEPDADSGRMMNKS